MTTDVVMDEVTATEHLEEVVRKTRRGKAASVAEVADVVEPAKAAALSGKAAILAFMEEPVEIFLHETTNPNEEPIVFVAVNGRASWLTRGQNHVVKRYIVEQLVRAKPTRIETVETRGYDGDRAIQVRRHSNMRYPFSVVRDDNPRGAAWLRELMAKRR